MKHSQDDCARLEHLLARMEDASGAPAHRADPTDALTPDDLAWAEAHVDACPRCAATASSDAALVARALRSAADDLPGDDFFAARRASILAAIAAEDVAASPARAPARRPAARLVATRSTSAGAERRPRVARRAPRFAWRRAALPAAVAAVLVGGLATALLLSTRQPEVARGPSAAGGAMVAVAPLEESRSIGEADDSWLVASNDLFAAELAEPAESAVDPLAALSDEELDEIEAVFLAAPGWS